MFKKLGLPQMEVLLAAKVEAFTSPAWASGQFENRQKIRAAMDRQLGLQWLKDISYAEFTSLKNLDKIPTFKKIHVSISHAADLGGFAISKSPVGFDIEVIERVKDVIVRRVSNEAEMINAPTPAHLWAAKEATYKALRSFAQPGVISELEIGAWNGGQFRLLNAEKFAAPEGVGICWVDPEHVYSLFSF
ncbi:MAG: 4'-phosphopantetheinyl transferase superfamily protein [Bdellovibrionaceae bacterium]|nr:4'-phosphopantetheinyl transferase superfamily protein [Pseudobdellovibrionaceae bacterium]